MNEWQFWCTGLMLLLTITTSVHVMQQAHVACFVTAHSPVASLVDVLRRSCRSMQLAALKLALL